MNEGSTLHRYASEAVGAFVLLAFVLFVTALYQGGRINEWLDPGLEVKILLPRTGLGGLSEGAQVEVLGSRAGEVTRIVIEPDKSIHAIARIESGMARFVTRDSEVFIQKRFGVAGDAFLDIKSGDGLPMDPEFAVLEARTEEAPIATVEALLTEIRDKVLPLIDDVASTAESIAEVAAKMNDPVGRLGSFNPLRALKTASATT